MLLENWRPLGSWLLLKWIICNLDIVFCLVFSSIIEKTIWQSLAPFGTNLCSFWFICVGGENQRMEAYKCRAWRSWPFVIQTLGNMFSDGNLFMMEAIVLRGGLKCQIFFPLFLFYFIFILFFVYSDLNESFVMLFLIWLCKYIGLCKLCTIWYYLLCLL